MDDPGLLIDLDFFVHGAFCVLFLGGTALGCLSALRTEAATKATGCSGGFDYLTVRIPFGLGGRMHGGATSL